VRIYAVVAALSGAAALIFEHLWFRSASVALGSSMWSSAIVLSAFMAGLALGSVGAMWAEPRLSRPLRAYGGIEIAIGLTGLVVLVVLPQLSGWLAPAFASVASSPLAVSLLRLFVAFSLLVVPAVCMGATLPVLMRALALSAASFGGKLGWVYGANTAGAVAGVLASEVILVPAFGLVGAGLVAAGLNGMAAFLAFTAAPAVMRREQGARPRTARSARVKAEENRDRGSASRPIPLLAAAFLCGAIFLAFEVATFRFLLLFFTALSTNFAAMLAVVLAGLATGGFAGARRLRRYPQVDVLLPAVAGTAGVALVLSYRLFPIALGHALTLEPTAAVVVAVLAFALPLAVLSGLLFAAVGHALYQTGLGDTRATGLLTMANTIGAMSGSMLTGVFLIERVGLERLFLWFAVAYGLVALLLVAATARPAEARRHRSLWSVAAAFGGALLLFPAGQMDAVFLRFPINQLSAAGERRVALKEGQLETLQYLRADTLGRPDYHRLVTNNHSMSSTDLRSRRYMRLFAHMPSILHPAPENAVLLGVGLGVTVKALTEDARFRSIDVVDVSPDIPAMLPVVYPEAAENPLRDPRVRLHVEDGRFFLATTSERYDVITAEPPPPHYAGVSDLYSREFFHLLAARLKPGGIATYWLPVHDVKADEAKAIVAAFLEAFPETTLWTGSGLDWIMMGLKPPGGGVTDEAFRAWWTRPPLSGRLREIGLERPEALGALFLADGPRLRAWVGDTPPVTDNFPRRISMAAPRDGTDTAAFVALMTARERPVNFAASPLIGSMWPPGLRAASLNEFARQSLVDAVLSLPALGVGDLQRLLGEDPIDPLLVKALFWRHNVDFDRTRALLSAEPGLDGVGLAEHRAQLALMNGNPREAADWLAQSISPRASELVTIRAYCLVLAGEKAAAERLLAAARRGS
jgi:spermidine synthase